jgi:hypothetical protein
MLELFLANNPGLELEVLSIPILEYETELFDIVIREQKTENVRIVINVCKTGEVMDYYSRLLVRQVIFPIDEIFVYDYQKNVWLANNYAESSVSFVLTVELASFAE